MTMILPIAIVSFLIFSISHTQELENFTDAVTLSGTVTAASSIPNLGGDLLPTGVEVSYLTYSATSVVNGSTAILTATFAEANGSTLSPPSTSTSSTTSFSILRGTMGAAGTSPSANTTSNSTASSTSSSSAAPTNTQPCNNHPEFCERKYSNITYVAAHNSPFVNPSNAASNQLLSVIDQLNDGIRMLQGQTHYNTTTKTISYCHTSCNLLNAGTAEEFFRNVTRWVRVHPYDVLTLLIGNSDFIGVGNYTYPLEASGLSQFAYVPPLVPMNLTSWPTLSSMILSGKRVVIFIDYNANQTEVPYILDEFSQMWETPFSPTNRSFPCTQQRPPGLPHAKAQSELMYMANHNLNTEIALAGSEMLIPTTALINETNAVDGYGSLGLMANACAAEWGGRPPNFLLVDYYNFGNVPGSVFEVAARLNNVSYTRPCCGLIPSGAGIKVPPTGFLVLSAALVGMVLGF